MAPTFFQDAPARRLRGARGTDGPCGMGHGRSVRRERVGLCGWRAHCEGGDAAHAPFRGTHGSDRGGIFRERRRECDPRAHALAAARPAVARVLERLGVSPLPGEQHHREYVRRKQHEELQRRRAGGQKSAEGNALSHPAGQSHREADHFREWQEGGGLGDSGTEGARAGRFAELAADLLELEHAVDTLEGPMRPWDGNIEPDAKTGARPGRLAASRRSARIP